MQVGKLEMNPKINRLIFVFSLITFFVYLLTSSGATNYNHFTLLADAFLHGKLFITADAPWLEKIPIDASRFYVANPPMPAILSLPFVALFGKSFPQNIIASLTGALITFFAMHLALIFKKDLRFVFWVGFLTGFGNIIWFLSAVGSTWYFGQVTACLFLLIALVESFTRKRAWLVGILIGAAYLSRINTIVGIPVFIYLLRDEFKHRQKIFHFVIALGTFLATNAIYNYLRFGVFWDKGY